MKRLTAFIALMTVVSLAHGQTTINVKLHLEDGSLIRCQLVTQSVPVETAFGTLTIPLPEVRSIKFRMHPSIADQTAIDDAVKMLGHADYKKREEASKLLPSFGRMSLPSLKNIWTKSGEGVARKDAEQLERAQLVIKQIVEADSRQVLELDLIRTSRFPVEGKIKLEELAFKSKALGDFKLEMGKLEALDVLGARDAVIVLDAAKHGVDFDSWKMTGMALAAGEVCRIESGGEVDFWPQQAGQYLSSPKGSLTSGKGGLYMAGALIGRIGKGNSFYIGESMKLTAQEEGELQLMIVPSPWNNASSGEYRVKIKAVP